MRAPESGAYFESGKRVTSSLNASNASRDAFGSRSVMSGVVTLARKPDSVVEVDQPLQVLGVVDVGMVRMQLDEAVGRGERRGALAVLVMAVRDLELRLLREAPVGIARLELLEVLDRLRQSLPAMASFASPYRRCADQPMVSSSSLPEKQPAAGEEQDDSERRGKK